MLSISSLELDSCDLRLTNTTVTTEATTMSARALPPTVAAMIRTVESLFFWTRVTVLTVIGAVSIGEVFIIGELSIIVEASTGMLIGEVSNTLIGEAAWQVPLTHVPPGQQVPSGK